MYFFEEAVDALLVDAFCSLQHVELNAHGRGEVNEGLNILGKVEPAEAEAGLEELRPMRGSRPIAWVTSSTSPPMRSQGLAITLA